jgi:hypothetical protein
MKKFAIMHSGNEIRVIEILTEFLLDYTLEEPVCRPREALIKSARADGRRFWLSRKF